MENPDPAISQGPHCIRSGQPVSPRKLQAKVPRLGKIWLNKAAFVERMSVADSQKKHLMGSKKEDLAEGFEVGSFSSFPRVNGFK